MINKILVSHSLINKDKLTWMETRNNHGETQLQREREREREGDLFREPPNNLRRV